MLTLMALDIFMDFICLQLIIKYMSLLLPSYQNFCGIKASHLIFCGITLRCLLTMFLEFT